jgi:hypothetical protein
MGDVEETDALDRSVGSHDALSTEGGRQCGIVGKLSRPKSGYKAERSLALL